MPPSPRRSPAGRVEPVRTCVGCRRRGAPDTFVRLARGPGGTVRVGRQEPGRGAWLCDDSRCFDLAVRRRALGRALRTELTEADLTKLRVRLYGAANSPEGAPTGIPAASEPDQKDGAANGPDQGDGTPGGAPPDHPDGEMSGER